MHLYAALAQGLADLGVDTMFGVIGDANLYMADSFVRDCGLRYIGSAHEAGAVLMALGYAQVSGRVGVATVTHGPGLTNTLTALVEGVKGNIPLMLVTGDTAEADSANPQNINQREFIVAAGAGFEQLRTPATLADDVARAYRRAIVESRPIVLNVPADFNWQQIAYRPLPYCVADNRAIVPSSVDLDNAVGIVAAARRPIILAGRGAASPEGKAALIRLAERTDALLATTLKGRSLFRGEDFAIGVFGTLATDVASELTFESDCVLAFGASLHRFTTGDGSLLKGKRLIHVDVAQTQIGKSIYPDAGMVGDVALTADRIVELLDMAEIAPSGWRSETLKQKIVNGGHHSKSLKTHAPDTIGLRHALTLLNDALPAERIVVQDGGRFMIEAWKTVHVSDPRSYVHTVSSASIGLGMGEAIGATAWNGLPTVLIAGDGGFMLGGLAEFNTAVRERLDVIVVVCNDGGYGAEYIQFVRKGMEPSLSTFAWPDFAPVAVALGGDGLTVRNETDLRAALDAIKCRKKPLLIDLKLDPDSLSEITIG
jgi:thiamine pyrophosphate-dependent acetolactate synthase large subunit-like protein